MLKVRINDVWTTLEPTRLMEMVLDGDLDRSAPALDLTQTETQGPLERFLGPLHCEELSGQVLQRLNSMYLAGSIGTDPVKFRARVEDLCRWDWRDPLTRSRLLWVAGWLAELTGSFERAIRHYDAFLHEPSSESHLRLLAHNNRGVLRIRLGRVDGVSDLARAAILVDSKWRESDQFGTLPAACFNLLNLLNLAIELETLRDDVEPTLIEFLARLPKPVRQIWVGPDPKLDTNVENENVERNGDYEPPDSIGEQDASSPRATTPDHKIASGGWEAFRTEENEDHEKEGAEADLRKHLSILRGPDFQRFNRLTTRLAAEAGKIAPFPEPDTGRLHEWIRNQFRLWRSRPEMDVAGDLGGRDSRQHGATQQTRHEDYSEAASLLYARHIPSTLRPQNYSIAWIERLAEENVGRAEEYLAAGAFDLARSTLESTVQALRQMNGEQRLKEIRRRVERQLQEVMRSQKAHDQIRLHEVCTAIQKAVREFCQLTELCQARLVGEDLDVRLDQLRSQLRDIWGEDSVHFTTDLAQCVTDHLRELEDQDLKARLEEPMQRLRCEWPDHGMTPAPKAAYDALAQCRLHDPGGRVEDWDRLRTQLDAHHAQYHFQRTLDHVARGNIDRKQVEASLAFALSLDPTLAPNAAMVFGLLHLEQSSVMPVDMERLREDLQCTAAELLKTQPLHEQGTWSAGIRADLIRQACHVLQRLFRAFLGVGSRVEGLWRELTKGFEVALTEGRPAIIDEIEQLVNACLDACPAVAAGSGARADPRNPLRIHLENCRRAKLLGLGEEALNAKVSQPAAAAESFTQALELGLERKNQLQRAVAGLYLARHGVDDPPELQRELLGGLDAWVEWIGEKKCGMVRPGDVKEAVDHMRRGELFDHEPETPESADSYQGSPPDRSAHIDESAGEAEPTRPDFSASQDEPEGSAESAGQDDSGIGIGPGATDNTPEHAVRVGPEDSPDAETAVRQQGLSADDDAVKKKSDTLSLDFTQRGSKHYPVAENEWEGEGLTDTPRENSRAPVDSQEEQPKPES